MADIDKQLSLRIAKLSDNNYRTWKIEMKWYLKGKGLLDHVLRKVELAELTTDEQRRTHQIQAIGLHIEPNQQVHIEDCTDARDAWIALDQVHQPKSRVRILQLKKKLYQSRMKEDESMSSYVSRVKIVVKNLNETGCEVRDDDTAYTLLVGLPNDYENLNMSLANLPDEQFTSLEITKILLTECDRRKSRCTDNNEDHMEALNPRKGPK
ncbi:PREDICTED: uncharacterized protein LOC107187094 [Dufourea novaeangliae]|uniref:uncharacterized protein LOC107187094 n=1 Tax=Dufourea novaeangliae TaxID=178035 RepID=UPI0007672AB7|nr:PREDICTED: uncharacterized protein LOC107187094 [Dufourea novaeangliae]